MNNKPGLKERLLNKRDNQWVGLVFVLPFIIGIVIVFSKVLFSGVLFAFSKVEIRNGLSLDFIAMENFKYALRVDANFVKLLISDINSVITSIPVIIAFSLFTAVVLNTKLWGRTAYRAIFFLPVIVCTGLIVKLDSNNFIMTTMNTAASETDSAALTAMGDVSRFLQQLEFSPGLIDAVASVANNVMDIVNRSGVQILIFLAGIQSISPSIYESAKVEGASGWSIFWKITLPMVTPMLLVNVIYTFIENLTRDSTKLMEYLNYISFTKGNYGAAAAMAWTHFIMLAVILVVLLLVVRLCVKFYNRKRMEVYI